MPNWCENNLTVSGPEQDIRRFATQARSEENGQPTDLSLERLYPIPKGIHRGALGINELQAAGKDSWYHWCIDNWGTKWDVSATLIEVLPTRLEYRFQSAWNPPVAWLVKVSCDFPSLRFKLTYDEPGMGFTGVTVVDQGTILVDENMRYA